VSRLVSEGLLHDFHPRLRGRILVAHLSNFVLLDPSATESDGAFDPNLVNSKTRRSSQ
jgi:hypothetical protein